MIFNKIKTDYNNHLQEILYKNIQEIEYIRIGNHKNSDIKRLYTILKKYQNDYDNYIRMCVTPMYSVSENRLNAHNYEYSKQHEETIIYISNQIRDIIDSNLGYITHVSLTDYDIFTRNGKIHSLEDAAIISIDGVIKQYFIDGEYMEYSVWKSHPIRRKLKIMQIRN